MMPGPHHRLGDELRIPQSAEQRMLLGIAELLVGEECWHLGYGWPDFVFLVIGRRWAPEDADPLEAGAWIVSTFSASYEIRDRGRLVRSSAHDDDASEQAARALVEGRRVIALRTSWPGLELEVELDGEVTLSAIPEHHAEEPSDRELNFWEIKTPEEPRRSLRAGQGAWLRIEPTILGPEKGDDPPKASPNAERADDPPPG